MRQYKASTHAEQFVKHLILPEVSARTQTPDLHRICIFRLACMSSCVGMVEVVPCRTWLKDTFCKMEFLL